MIMKTVTNRLKILPRDFFLWILLFTAILVITLFVDIFLPILIALIGAGLCVLVIKRPRFILYFLALILPYQIGYYIEALFGITFTPQLVLSLFTLGLIFLKIITSHKIRIIPLGNWWLLFVLLTTFSILQNASGLNPVQDLWIAFRLAIANALIYLFYWWFNLRRRDVHTMLVILAFSTIIPAIIAITQTISSGNLLSGVMTNGRFLGVLFKFPPEVLEENISSLRTHFYLGQIFRAHGTFYRVNGFGAFMSMAVCLTWGLFRGAQGKQRNLLLLAFGAQIAGILASFSRSAWAGALVALTLAITIEMFIWKKKKLTWQQIRLFVIASIIGIIIVSIVLSFNTLSQRFSTLLNPNKVGEFNWRMDIWSQAMQSIKARPWFGAGTDIVIRDDPRFGLGNFGAHNLFIGIAYEFGVPVLGIMIYLLWQLFHSAWVWLNLAQTDYEKAIATGIISAGVAFLIAGMGGTLIDTDNIAILFWLILAIAVQSRLNLQKGNSADSGM
jgi:hypothetical protein